MDPTSLLRTFGSLGAVLGLLSLALWATRRYNIRLPGATQVNGQRRLAVVERIALDGRRSVALIRRDGREHLLLISPEGHQIVESGIEVPQAANPAEAGDFAYILAATTAAHARVTFSRDAKAALQTIAARVSPALAGIQSQARRIATRVAPYWDRVRAKAQPPKLGVAPRAPAPRGNLSKPRPARPSKIHAMKPATKRAPARG